MVQAQAKNAAMVGTKRKLSVGAEVKLTPSQLLKAARNAARLNAESVASTGVTENKAGDVETGEDQGGRSEQKRDDEYYRRLYTAELDFKALAEKVDDFRAWYVFCSKQT
jgi:hypothetical protein